MKIRDNHNCHSSRTKSYEIGMVIPLLHIRGLKLREV